MIFTKPAHRSVSAEPPPTVPDPTLAWWKFHEHNGASVIPDATGNGYDMTIQNFSAGNWTTENGRAAYYFDGTSGQRAESTQILHGIDTGPFTLATRGNPRNFAAAGGHTVMANAAFSPSVLGDRSGTVQYYWAAYRDSGIASIANTVNWFILRRESNGDTNIFFDGQKGVTTNNAARILSESTIKIASNGQTFWGEFAVDESRFYDVALTDQECLDLMLDV